MSKLPLPPTIRERAEKFQEFFGNHINAARAALVEFGAQKESGNLSLLELRLKQLDREVEAAKLRQTQEITRGEQRRMRNTVTDVVLIKTSELKKAVHDALMELQIPRRIPEWVDTEEKREILRIQLEALEQKFNEPVGETTALNYYLRAINAAAIRVVDAPRAR